MPRGVDPTFARRALAADMGVGPGAKARISGTQKRDGMGVGGVARIH